MYSLKFPASCLRFFATFEDLGIAYTLLLATDVSQEAKGATGRPAGKTAAKHDRRALSFQQNACDHCHLPECGARSVTPGPNNGEAPHAHRQNTPPRTPNKAPPVAGFNERRVGISTVPGHD